MAICANCGAELPLRFRFCGSCGTPLPATSEHEVRKLVTVLFCDLMDSTAFGERVDSELVRRVLRRYFAVLERVIVEHGGLVEKFIGDAVMAVFGLPVAHEDDALRAVKAAAEIRTRLVPAPPRALSASNSATWVGRQALPPLSTIPARLSAGPRHRRDRSTRLCGRAGR